MAMCFKGLPVYGPLSTLLLAGWLAGRTSVSPIDINQETGAFHQHVLILIVQDNPRTASLHK
jgi:hypothetical protein